MHEGRRPFVHLFSYHLKAGRIRRGQGPEARKATEDSGRRLQREGFWPMGPGGGTGRLPGVPGCDILELRIWYKNRSTAAGLALPDVGAERILFFRRGACDER